MIRKNDPQRSAGWFDDLWSAGNLTRSQLLLYLGQKVAPDVPLYNMALVLSIDGNIDPDLFRRAFRICVDQRDALRTVFSERDGKPRQTVLDETPADVEFVDLSADPDPQRALEEWSRQRTLRLFNLDQCLFDSALLQLETDRFAWYLNQHHLITDAWATGIIYNQVSATYARLKSGDSASPRLPQFSEYRDFERKARNESSRKDVLEYWDLRRDSAFHPPSLYGQSRRHESTSTIRITRELDSRICDGLQEVARQPYARAFTQHQALFTLFATLLVAWQYRVSGERRLSIGTPAHNRPTLEFKETVGPFIELFPLQLTIEDNETFASLIGKVRDEANGFLLHAQPGASHPDLQRSYNVVLNYITASFGDFSGLPMRSEWVHCGHGDIGHHLRLQVHDFDTAGEIVLHFDFNEAVFDKRQRDFAIDHILCLISALIKDPSRPVDSIGIVGPNELELVTDTFNSSDFPLPGEPTVVHGLARTVTERPEAVAIRCGKRTMSYQALDDQSGLLAGALASKGVGRGDVVGLSMQRSVESVIAILAILKCGAAYLPIDPQNPAERTSFILEDAHAKAMITDSEMTTDLSIPILRPEDRATDRSPPRLDAMRPDRVDAAYIIYTSGSTGQPKGVVIEHHSLFNYAAWARSRYAAPPPNASSPITFPLFSPLTFDLTVTSIFVPLISGGEIVVYPQPREGGDFSLLDVIEENVVDVIKLTPSHLALLRGRDLSGSRVRSLILGGEDLKRDLAQSTLEAFGGNVTIFNEYGPTEATVGCMIHAFDPVADRGASVPIGIPAGNAKIYLLDESLNLVPRGVTGEIYIAGEGLAREYHNRPALTAERFVENVFDFEKRLYRTGDLARMNMRGVLEYLGRTDDQVKVRGVRIELGEIEAVLSEHPGVDEAAVKLINSNPGAPDVTHYCVKCGLPSNYPSVSFDGQGVCHLCNGFQSYKNNARRYFRGMEELNALLREREKSGSDARYHCMMLLSGGKDSSYALCRLVDLGVRVFAFTLDNGYLSDQAKQNISRVAEALGVDHLFGTTPAMKEIFADSLRRYSNVCNGCFKTLYTLAIKRAKEMEIPYIITGLSRGQFFETRLTEELFQGDDFDPDAVDQVILEARKAYHRADDSVNRMLDGSCFQSDEIFREVQFLDFFRFCDASLQEMLDYLEQRVPWVRPTDTGRSTNCLINDAGIFVHKRERGFHNYAFPYSWDVRIGHKQRDDALAELDDEIDEDAVREMLDEVGYEVRDAVDDTGSSAKLCAYFVANQGAHAGELRAFLTNRLPAYMVPSHFVHLDRMPLTPNGKLNRTALPDPGEKEMPEESRYTAPGNDTESTLADIWAKILRVNRVGIHDNFLDLGGDSIMAIQVVSRANEAGLNLTPGQLFANQTIAELGKVADEAVTFTADQGLVSGAIELTPVQRWFFEKRFPEIDHWNQALVVSLPADVTAEQIEKSLRALLRHHDILRTCYLEEGKTWRASTPEQADFEILVEADSASAGTVEEDLQRGLDVRKGRLIACAALSENTDRKKLLLVIHHLAMDAVSWPILLADLATAIEQTREKAEIQFQRKTTSFKHWAAGLIQAAAAVDPETVKYWVRQPAAGASIPHDSLQGDDTESSAALVSASLSEEETDLLVTTVPKQHRVQPNEMLLAALSLTLREWVGDERITIELEGHGREDLVRDADVTRTVGWFTTRFPLFIDLAGIRDRTRLLLEVKDQYRAIPHRGASYGLLRYLHPDKDLRDKFESKPAPDVLFNYLGHADQLIPENSMFELDRPLTLSRGPANARTQRIEINATIVDGALRIDWGFSSNIHEARTIQHLADQLLVELKELLSFKTTDQPILSAGDFPEANLDRGSFDKLSRALGKLDDSS